MIIGAHELKGSIEKLQQPFVILQREESPPSLLENDSSSSDTLKEEIIHSRTSYNIAGIVTYKLLFSKYPKTILARR
jgi:Ctf8